MAPSENTVRIPKAFGSQRMASGQLSSVQRQKRSLDQGLTTLQSTKLFEGLLHCDYLHHNVHLKTSKTPNYRARAYN